MNMKVTQILLALAGDAQFVFRHPSIALGTGVRVSNQRNTQVPPTIDGFWNRIWKKYDQKSRPQ